MNDVYLGIDPGFSGAIAALYEDHVDVLCMPLMPALSGKGKNEIDVVAIKEWIQKQGFIKLATIELVHSMPRQGTTSSFHFGQTFGTLIGIIRTLGIPLAGVSPQKWKKTLFGKSTSDKQVSIDYIRKNYPDVNLLRTPKCTKPHDGIAEAICLAEYGKKTISTVGA